jgi:hypothetical protein
MPTKAEFRSELQSQLREAELRGTSFEEVNAGQLHRKLGGYPALDHRMPSCCNVMWEEKRPSDVVLSAPRKGRGASLTIRYQLPR